MKIYDSYSKETREFKPTWEIINMYVCGLTPYDHAHIGHTRMFVSFDMIKRYLIKKGFRVFHMQNITDVDDKIIKRCKESATDPKKLTESMHGEALLLLDELGVIRADVYPKVTEHISDIIAIIGKLIKNGYAYETATGVYYKVGKFKNYGNLSGQRLDEIEAGARVEIDETKEAPEDFALWKKTKDEIIEFGSPWGKGRPGWHIECSAMALKYAPRGLDIHGGARDLIFPHHENEIAQSEAACGGKFANFWMHVGFLTVNGEKMSKSLGNFVTLKDALKKATPNAIRMFMLSSHYRSPVDYDEEKIGAADEACERIFNCLGLVREAREKKNSENKEFRASANQKIAAFYSSLDNDFDTPAALAALFDLVREANSHASGNEVDQKQLIRISREMQGMLRILGLQEKSLEQEKSSIESKAGSILALAKEFGIAPKAGIEDTLSELVNAREEARKNKEYAKSDEIRKKLAAIGITLEDAKGKARWKIS